MRKLAALALIAIVGGAWYVIHDVGHVPIFDARLQRLAESPAEAYCAGQTFWEHQGRGDAQSAADCRKDSKRDAEPDLTAVLPAFCLAVTDAGYQNGVEACLGIVEGQKLWPTRDGDLTNAWSETAPYPGDLAFVVPADDSRTGSRDGFSRDDEPTTTTAEETTTTGADG